MFWKKKTQGEANSLNSIEVLGLGYAILQQLIKLLVFIKNEKILFGKFQDTYLYLILIGAHIPNVGTGYYVNVRQKLKREYITQAQLVDIDSSIDVLYADRGWIYIS